VDPEDGNVNRRDALIGLLGAVATPVFFYGATDSEREAAREAGVPAEPVALAAALRAQTVYAGFCIPIIEKNVTAPYELLISLAIRDAGTFDAQSGTGGLNGSVRFELDKPENRKFKEVVKQLGAAKKEIDSKVGVPIGWADLIGLAPFAAARYQFLRDYCGVTPRYEPRWQYKAGDINIVGCDMDDMLKAPYGHSPEQIEATSWFRQSFAGVGPLTGQRVHMGRKDVFEADAVSSGGVASYPLPGATAEEYKRWFKRMRLSLPALVNLAPFVDETCEATLRSDPECQRLFAEIDTKSYAPGYKEKPLIKALREMTLRGPAESADPNAYVVVDRKTNEALAAIPLINGKVIRNVKTLMAEYHDPFPVWIM
jgi:L-ascorbate peroxidase